MEYLEGKPFIDGVNNMLENIALKKGVQKEKLEKELRAELRSGKGVTTLDESDVNQSFISKMTNTNYWKK